MSEETAEGLARVEMQPTEITDVQVSLSGDLVRIRFSDGGESVRGSLMLSREAAQELSMNLAEAIG